MSKTKLVGKMMPTADLAAIMNNTKGSVGLFSKYMTNLDNEERKKGRTIATSRIGLVSITEDVVKQYADKFGPKDDIPGYLARIVYHKALGQLRNAAQALLENTDDTHLALGIDLMEETDKFIGLLEVHRLHDGDLDLAMEAIDEYKSRFVGRPKEEKEKDESTDTKPDTTADSSAGA